MIELLPANIANQIAAGEVVQRGASIVKELVENAIDAGATRVTIRVEDGGRTLIQVIDNGCGMTAEDAPKAFLRHATSKIKTIEELFALRTFGFRGEALASISSVAEVELTTRTQEEEVGTCIVMRDGVEIERKVCACAVGTAITVRNLFYSVPARRKFLKTDSYEAKLCKTEFIRVALINEQVGFEYYEGSTPSIVLMPQNRLGRIVALTRSSYAKKLLPIEVVSPIVSLGGYVAIPDTAKAKGRGEQYLFVNGRYFRNNRLFKAICDAYGRLLGTGVAPNYFLYLNVEPDKVDVNINPTKTEVKFEDEDSIVQIIASAVKQTLGRHNIVEAIDFNGSQIDIPTFKPSREFVAAPTFEPKPKYNPFDNSGWESESIPESFDEQKAHFDEGFILSDLDNGFSSVAPVPNRKETSQTNNFSVVQSDGFDDQSNQTVESSLFDSGDEIKTKYSAVQFCDNRYLALNTMNGLAIINIGRARQRIEYERIVLNSQGSEISSHRLVIPHNVELTITQKSEVLSNISLYNSFGFSIEDDGGSSVSISALPVGFDVEDFVELVGEGATQSVEQRLAMIATANISKQSSVVLSHEQIEALVDRLMNCEEPNYTPTGLKVIDVIDNSDIENRFKR